MKINLEKRSLKAAPSNELTFEHNRAIMIMKISRRTHG